MSLSIAVIGDPHFKKSNIPDCRELINQTLKWISTEKDIDAVCVLGDTIDTFQNYHESPFNLAQDFFDELRKLKPLYILIGNHDLENNNAYLSKKHAFNALKYWNNVHVVDTGLYETIKGFSLVFVPFVQKGLFSKAYNEIVKDRKVDLIFAHQEFRGCEMPNGKSLDGDIWLANSPPIVSGHIHIKNSFNNIHYIGAPLQHNFDDDPDRFLAKVTLLPALKLTYFKLAITPKITKKITVAELKNFELPEGQVKLIIKGDISEIKAIAASEQIRILRKQCRGKLFFTYTDSPIITKVNTKRAGFLETFYNNIDPSYIEYTRMILE